MHECDANRTATARLASLADRLTSAERVAILGVATHGTRQEAADCLGIAEATITHQLTDVYRKLEVETLTEALDAMGWLCVGS